MRTSARRCAKRSRNGARIASAVLEGDPHQRVGDGQLEVGVLADHERALAAQLEDRRRDLVGRRVEDVARRRDPAGEGDLVDAGVTDERGAGLGAEAGEDVDEAGRDQVGGAEAELDDARGGELGRLKHDGVAGRERRRDLQRGRDQRRVPGDQRGDHADRLALGPDAQAGVAGRDVVAVGGPREPGVVAEDRDRGRHVGHRGLAQRAPVLGRQQRRPVGVGLDPVGDRGQQRLALGRAAGAPAPQGAARGDDGLVDVLDARLRELRPRAADARVDRVERRVGGDRLAADHQGVGLAAGEGGAVRRLVDLRVGHVVL
jgi:ParB family chromosome partitioning protein